MSVLSLPDAKAHLNIEVPTYDGEIQSAIDAAEGIISEMVGPLVPTSVTDRVVSNGAQIMLRTTPVISLTSVSSVYATQTADVASLFVSPAGVVSWSTGRNVFFAGPYDVTYIAGRSTVPAGLLFAIKELVRHLWTPQQGGGIRPGSATPATTPGFLIPNLVREAMEPYVQDLGFA